MKDREWKSALSIAVDGQDYFAGVNGSYEDIVEVLKHILINWLNHKNDNEGEEEAVDVLSFAFMLANFETDGELFNRMQKLFDISMGGALEAFSPANICANLLKKGKA